MTAQRRPVGRVAGWQATLGDALLTEEQMKMSFMPLLYKLMYELSRSVYRATYTTAYLQANAGQRLSIGCEGCSIDLLPSPRSSDLHRDTAEPPQ